MQNLHTTNGNTQQCCGEHRRRLELFCKEDEAFVCVLCVPGHSSHSFVFLHEAVSVYKDKLKIALASLESKVHDLAYLQNKQKKELDDIWEDGFSLKQYITQEFAKLHQFLHDREQKLIQQLKSEEAEVLKEVEKNLECIKRDISYHVAVSNISLMIKNEETEILQGTEENLEYVKNDVISTHMTVCDTNLVLKHESASILKEEKHESEYIETDVMTTREMLSDRNMEVGHQEPVGLLTVPETFDDAITFSEEEWKMLRKQDKELHREETIHNYETLVSVGIRSTENSVSCNRQSSVGAQQLYRQAENLQQCAQPVKGYDKCHVAPVPPLHLEHKCSKTSECEVPQRPFRGKKLYKCVECSKCFTCRSSLRQHSVSHTGEKPYKCTECSKCFSYLSGLRQHLATHTGKKPYKCTECSKCYPYHTSLRRHLAAHTGDKPYKCTECGKCFTQKVHLEYHQYTHTGMKE
ncbi:zinc finger protein 578-like [Protopterus annectens]|uniref:zinc finger protein 578-like n=1 Tax=Protopterus annectens TaxID=7888 RepID=UPI001CFA5B75|nr:zinc finger protein 578-like [Protopterus annectens]